MGNGRAIAVVAGRAGATVACADLDTDAARATADLVEAEGATAHVFTADVSDSDACAGVVDAAAAAMDGLDGLVCNVGIGAGMGMQGTTPERSPGASSLARGQIRGRWLAMGAIRADRPRDMAGAW
jgi:NAD(P)-dependent dehydrogenase (short-subunit alcohol dehydrogenase family)